jgi:4-carboxymuconolactone decarboxylase
MSDERPFGRHRTASGDELSPEEREARDLLTSGPRGGVSGPYRIWVSNPPLVRALVELDQHLNGTDALSAAEREIAVLVTAARWDARYVAAAHLPRAAASGVPPDAAERILAGDDPALPEPRQQAVYNICRQLYAGGELPEEIFKRANALLGARGLSDLIALLGYYTSVALTLNAYAVRG